MNDTNTQAGPLYGGFKMIHAIPMTAGEASKKGYRIVNDGEPWTDPWPGYEVQYEDGYLSWSPADAFERAYDLIGQCIEGQEVHSSHLEILGFFQFEHLPPRLQEVSRPFTAMAWRIAHRSKNNLEAYVAIRKLLEAKDAAVRACL